MSATPVTPANSRNVFAWAMAFRVANLSAIALYLMPAMVIPTHPGELAKLLRVWEREAALSNSALLLECDGIDRADAARESAISHWMEASRGVAILSHRERRNWREHSLVEHRGHHRPILVSKGQGLWRANVHAELPFPFACQGDACFISEQDM